MASFHVQFAGTKYTVSGLLPTQQFSAVVEMVCSQLKTPVQPETCSLKHGKTVLKPSDPIRFAGLPRGATLIMESSAPSAPRLGFAEQPQNAAAAPRRVGTSSSTAAIAAAPSPPVAAAAAPTRVLAPQPDAPAVAAPRNEPLPAPQRADAAETPAASSSDDVEMISEDITPGPAGLGAAQSQSHADAAREVPQPVDVLEPVATAAGTLQTHDAAPASVTAANRPSVSADDRAGTSASHASAAAERHAPPTFHSELGVRPAMTAAQLLADAQARKYDVFSLTALANESAGVSGFEDLPDDFYELTPADVQTEMLAMRRRQQYNEAGLRTKARREQEAASKAAAIGHATIRLLLPFGMVVQVDFAPFDKLLQLQAFVRHVVLTEQFGQSFHLFTTPPKTVLTQKDLSATFWDRGMVPGAQVHVGIEHQDFAGAFALEQPCQPGVYKAFLRSEVLAREGPAPKAPPPKAATKRAAGAEDASARLAGAEFVQSGSTKVAPSGGKVPKWFKLSK